MKEKIREEIGDCFCFDNEVEITELKELIVSFENKGATHIEISSGDYTIGFQAIKERFETDSEYDKRVKKENFNNRMVELAEKREFERIKAKYNM